MPVSGDDVVEIRNERLFGAPSADSIFGTYQSYANHYNYHKQFLTSKLDPLYRGEWSVVWPDQSVTGDIPKIGNQIKTGIEDIGKLTGNVEPTTVCDPSGPDDKAQKNASLRQKVLHNYREVNNLRRDRVALAMDLAGAGLACWVVWPDPDESKPLDQRFPLYIRKDPRLVYPDPSWTGGEDINDCLIAYKRKARTLDTLFPGKLAELFTRGERRDSMAESTMLEFIEYHDRDASQLVAVWNKSGTDTRTTVLYQLENPYDKPLAVIGIRPTFDGRFHGQFDEAFGPLESANRMLVMAVDAMESDVYAGKNWIGDWESRNSGPGAENWSRDPNARVERTPTASVEPQIFAFIQLLLENSRLSSGVSQARQGDIEQSIGSAAFVTSLQGTLVTQVQDYHRVISDMEREANSRALCIDEKLLGEENGEPVRKVIAGAAEGRAFSTTYSPSKDIAGNYQNRVVYGEGSGIDQISRTTHVLTITNAGLRSRRWASQQLPGDVDVLGQENEIARESMRDSVLAAFLTPPEQGGPPLDVRLQAMKMLSEGKTVEEVANELLVTPPQPEPTPGIAPEQPGVTESQVLSLQQGGIVGNAESAPAAPVPSLEELGVG